MAELAPIVLFAYNRPDQLETTIEYLSKNSLADQSTLIVFSDGHKNHKEITEIEKVREVIKQIRGFKSVSSIFREKNMGLANSVISGVTQVFEKHDSVIVVEDDLITSPNFLSYMNDALKFYEKNKNIFSITGYSLPLDRKNKLPNDVFFSPRAGSWGWATWKDRWLLADWDVSDFKYFETDKNAQVAFNRGGEDLTSMLKAQMKGNIDSWTIRWFYTLFQNNGLCVYPVRSKVNLIEGGGKGTNVKDNSIFRVELDSLNLKTQFTTDFSLDEKLLSEINNFMKPSLIRKIINYFKYNLIK